MLDQNTDRLWYVIGAVLIGAAIILMLNGTVPDLFAQVAGIYEEKTEEAMSGAEHIVLGENLLNDSENGVGETFHRVEWPGWDYRLYSLPFDEYDIEPGDTFTFSFYVDNPTHEVAAFLQARDATNRKFVQSPNGNVIQPGESGVTSITWTVPEKTNSAVNETDRTPAEPVILYASIRDTNNWNRYERRTTATYNNAQIRKHEGLGGD